MEGVRGGRNAKRERRGTGWRRSRRARSVQVVAGIPDQYFHRFSGGYRQVASSLAPFPTLIPLLYSDDAIFLLPLFPSFYRALSTPVVVCASPSSLFLFDLPVLRSFPSFFFALFSPTFSSPLFRSSFLFLPLVLHPLPTTSLIFYIFWIPKCMLNMYYYLILILFNPLYIYRIIPKII